MPSVSMPTYARPGRSTAPRAATEAASATSGTSVHSTTAGRTGRNGLITPRPLRRYAPAGDGPAGHGLPALASFPPRPRAPRGHEVPLALVQPQRVLGRRGGRGLLAAELQHLGQVQQGVAVHVE